jgi:hypothetical protein
VKFIFAVLLFLPSLFGADVLTVTKTPYERINCTVDFGAVVSSDLIVLDSVVTTLANGATTQGIVAASPAPAITASTSTVTLQLTGGAARATYYVSVRVSNSSTGEKWDGVITLNVSAGP